MYFFKSLKNKKSSSAEYECAIFTKLRFTACIKQDLKCTNVHKLSTKRCVIHCSHFSVQNTSALGF